MAKKEAFGGKIIDLKESGLYDMTLGEMIGKKRIAPTEVVGALWKALREVELIDGICYFGTPKEIGYELDKDEIKERKAKLKR